jgi:hypothetical protein
MRLLILLTLLLGSCSAVQVEGENLICFLCMHTKVKADKKPAEAGSKTKSTEDFSDPQKDQAPQDDAEKQQPVKPER